MPAWNDPVILYPALISAAAGLVGAAIGGWCTLGAATKQFTREQEERQRDWMIRVGRQIHTVMLMISVAESPAEFTEAVLTGKKIFFENPEIWHLDEDHQRFFRDHLIGISARTPPSDLHWTDARKRMIKADAERLLHPSNAQRSEFSRSLALYIIAAEKQTSSST